MLKLPSDQFIDKFSPLQEVTCCEFIKAHQAIDFFDFWEALEKEIEKQCIPFWGAVWPGAKSLARFIRENKQIVDRKNILDFGCGSGIVSIASAMSGAGRVVANDIDPIALHIAKKNFKFNNVDIEVESEDLLKVPVKSNFDLIFVVDMFYERSTSGELLDFLNTNINRGAEVIIADGGRPFAPTTSIQQLYEEVLRVDKELEGVDHRRVRILKLSAA